jgi:hypothetical protein
VDPHDDGTLTLAIVDVLDRDGRARATIPVRRWPISIGRAVACDIVLDDPYVAAQHATLSADDGAVRVAAGETVNGVLIRKRRLAAGEQSEVQPGDVIQVGGTRLRVRLAADAVAPERRWVPEQTASFRPVAALLLVFTIWGAAEQWLRTDPGGRLMEYVPVLLGAPIMLAIWAGFWSVGSKLVRHRFDFWGHARVALVAMLAMSLVMLVLPVFAFVSGLTWPSRIGPLVTAALGWAAIAAHIGRILPGRPRVLAAVMATLFVAGAGLYSIHQYETADRVFPELYVTTLAPPSLRLAGTVTSAQFVQESRELKAVVDAHIDDDDDGSSSDDD